MSEITRILSQIERGDPAAAEQLLPLVYDELRKLAAQKLTHEKPGQTLQATALVHEAYLRLVGVGKEEGGERKEESEGTDAPPASSPHRPIATSPFPAAHWHSRGHFFAAAAEAMRRILVEQARRKGRERHGGRFNRVELIEDEVSAPADDERILLLDEALNRLAVVRPQAAEFVKLRYFSGLTVEEAAPVLGLSSRTARRLWAFARAWLRREMDRAADSTS